MGWGALQAGAVRLLFIGDVVGEPGRRAVRQLLPALRERLGIGWVVANGENSAGGNGITGATAQELFGAGVDGITTGDHVWDQRETAGLLVKDPRIVRPINYPEGVPGNGWMVLRKDGLPLLGVLNVQGRTFMPPLENPFTAADRAVTRLRAETPIVLVDFHAEATSEKIAMGRFLDGRVSAVIGTHTHVQTADEWIMPKGTAYLSDAGFTGPHDSVLGREVEPVLNRFLTQMPQRFEVASGRVLLQGAWVDVDESTGLAGTIQRVSEPLDPGQASGRLATR